MEAALKRSAGTGEEEATISIQERRRTSKSNCEEEDCQNKHVLLKDNQLELAKAEMCEVRQENKRLKLYLDKMMMDYQTLKKKFHTISHEQNQAHKIPAVKELGPEDSEFVSLSLGRTMSLPIHDQAKGDYNYNEKHSSIPKAEEFRNINLQDKEGFVKLGLDHCNFDVPETAESPPNPSLDQNSSEEVVKEDLAGEKKISSPKGNVKTMRSNADDIENSVQQNPTKKARVSVRVRCDTPTMNDGCQWRKYGQKIAKGNPCPRAYYRCTVAPSCPVRKQVQRCSDDMSILITTYEGTHSHPLPISATAMASTTSAAAVMLLSGSSSSSEPGPTPSATAVAAQQLHGLNFYLSKPNPPFYLNSSNTSSPSCPTITLDLANTSSSSHFNPMSASNNFGPKYYSNNNYSTNLNFSTTTLESSTSPWNYSAHQSPFNQIGLLNFGSRQPQENLYHSFMQKKNGNYNNVTPTQQSSHSIEAATKAITSDPNFQSALAAALTSIIGTNNNTSRNAKLEQPFPPVTSSSFGLQPLNSQSSNLRFLSPPLPVSSSKTNSSASPGDSNS